MRRYKAGLQPESMPLRRASVIALLAMVLATLLAPAGALSAPALGAHPEAAHRAVEWMVTQQQPDGSFPGFGVGSTAEAIYALAAGNRGHAREIERAVAYLEQNAVGYARSPGAAAKLLLALAAAGRADRAGAFGGVDLPGFIGGQLDPASGRYGQDLTGHVLSMLALKAVGQPVPEAARRWLIGAQAPSGGWAFDGSTAEGAADTNTTGLALQALAAAGGDWGEARSKALAYLKSQQNEDAGWAFQRGPGNESDANSTASAIQGLIAAGEDPEGGAWDRGGSNPVRFLLGLQNPGGAFRYQATAAEDNAGATYQAVPAALAMPLPIVGAAAAPQPGMPRTGSDDAGQPWLLLLAGAMAAAGGIAARRLAKGVA